MTTSGDARLSELNVQIEGLADRETWPEPRKLKKPQAAKRTLIGQSRSNAELA